MWVGAHGVCRTSSKQERLKEYLDVLNVPDLTEEELESITNGGSGTHHRAFVSILLFPSRPRSHSMLQGKHMDEL
jgi:hypothetical protein